MCLPEVRELLQSEGAGHHHDEEGYAIFKRFSFAIIV